MMYTERVTYDLGSSKGFTCWVRLRGGAMVLVHKKGIKCEVLEKTTDLACWPGGMVVEHPAYLEKA